MSVDYSTYVGPYFRCQNTRVGARMHVRSCSNKECQSHTKPLAQDFCGSCGTGVGDVEVFVKHRKVSTADITEKVNERLTVITWNVNRGPLVDVDVWVPNVPVEGLRSGHLPDYFTAEVQITADQLTQELFLLATHMAAERAVLAEAYGDGNVKLFWGAVGSAR